MRPPRESEAPLAGLGRRLLSLIYEALLVIAVVLAGSLPFVMFGVLDYLRRAHVQKAGGSPVDLLLTSPVLLATGVGWLLSVVWSVKFP